MPLTYRDKGSSGTQWDVLSGELVIGNINKGALSLAADRDTPWSWHFRLHVAPPGFVMHGVSVTLDAAQADMERNWQRWLEATGLRPLSNEEAERLLKRL
jgi:hypothetical protein